MPYIDLEYKLRTDDAFYNEIARFAENLKTAGELAATNPSVEWRYKELLNDFLIKCDNNPVMLTPYFFPKYPLGTPLNFLDYPFAWNLFRWEVGSSTVIRGSRQISKCRPVNALEPVYGVQGQLLYPEDLTVGQRVLCLDQNNQRACDVIVAKHPTGKQMIYSVELRSGQKFMFSGGHLLRTFDTWTPVESLNPGSKVAEVNLGGFFGSVSADHARIVLTAYMIGDGCMGCSGNQNFTSACADSLAEFSTLAQPLQLLPIRTHRKQNNKASSICLSRLSVACAWWKEDGLWKHKAWEKFIPDWVFQLPAQETRLFLSRLWSTDGTITQTNKSYTDISYVSTSRRLAAGVKSLLLKFGILSTVNTGVGKCYGKAGHRYYKVRIKTRASIVKFCQTFNDIPGKPVTHIMMTDARSNNNDDVLPNGVFSILNSLRKACQHVPEASFKPNGLKLCRQYNPGREKLERYLSHGKHYVPDHESVARLDYWLNKTHLAWSNVKSVTPVGVEDTWDIETETHHNYILDGLVAHNSTAFAARQILTARLIPNFTTAYICPRNDQLETYANRLRDVERAQYDFTSRSSDFRSNLRLKEFSNGSKIELMYAHTSATNTRGHSVSEILIDESQDFDPDLEIEIDMMQSASKTPINMYGGTSLTTDTFLEKKYLDSSQASWIIKCPGCNHSNIPLPEFNVMDMIQPQGPSCSKCGKLLDVTSGHFVHADMQSFAASRYGYHIPQLIVPAVVNNPVRWERIYRQKHKGNPGKFLQEILGIPVEEGSRELTKQQLQDMCILGKDLQALKQKAASGKYQWVVSGCDWGGSDYQPMTKSKISTTVHVICGITPDGFIDILHFNRLTGMDYDTIAGTIIAEFKAYGGFAIASDTGVGQAYNDKLRYKIPQERHLMFTYSGPDTQLIAEPKRIHLFNTWMLNKTDSLTFTFEAIRNKRIRCFSWEYAEEYLMDCLNMYRAPGEKAGGAGTNTFVYRASASKPNDALQAINYAHMLARIVMGEPMFADQSMKNRIEMILRGQQMYIDPGDHGAYSG